MVNVLITIPVTVEVDADEYRERNHGFNPACDNDRVELAYEVSANLVERLARKAFGDFSADVGDGSEAVVKLKY